MVEKIKKLCDESGMSLNDLEEQIEGVGVNTIYRWDISAPNVMRVKAVAEFFNVSMDWLLDREVPITDQETELIRKFQMLSDAQKEMILSNVDFLLSQKPIRKETQIS